jgi:beta-glucanase (GH16 family)
MSTLIRVLTLLSVAELCILCPLTTVRPAGAITPPPGYATNPDWSDDFNGTALDQSHWGYRLLGPRNDGINTTDAVSVGGGLLTINTYTGPDGKHYTGMIGTGGPLGTLQPPGNKFTPLYGYFEASIQFKGLTGMWSSFWMQSDNMSHPAPYFPHSYGTEMDIVEHPVVKASDGICTPSPTDPSVCDLSSQGSSSILWDGYCSVNPDAKSAGGDRHGTGLASGFHTYGFEWTPTYEKYYYDGTLVWTVNDSPDDPATQIPCPWGAHSPQSPSVPGPVSHTNEYIILSSEVRNDTTWCGSTPTSYGPLGDSNNPKMDVQYVRHYPINPPSRVVDLCAVSPTNTTMQVSWTAPTDPPAGLAEYDLRYSTSPGFNFNGAPRVPTLAPHSPGSKEYLTVSGLSACTTYYFAIKTKDAAGNWSDQSNSASATTVCGHQVSRPEMTEQVIQCGGGASPAPVKVDESSLSFSAPSPNPARDATEFQIQIPGNLQGATFRVDVFDVAGRRVRSLVDRTASQGQAQVDWNLLDDSGRRVASGLYRVRVGIGDTRKTFPLLVLR